MAFILIPLQKKITFEDAVLQTTTGALHRGDRVYAICGPHRGRTLEKKTDFQVDCYIRSYAVDVASRRHAILYLQHEIVCFTFFGARYLQNPMMEEFV
ncbi:MAG: hypothetical protein FWE19_01255 [Oscillospiraceae bacterium]|nr:hypothetical protein [Oscillospiraceae bacterium]